MTFQQWSKQRVFTTYKDAPEDVRQMMRDTGLCHEDDIVMVYPDGSFITCVEGNFEVLIGNSDMTFNSSSEAEKHLWESWAKSNQ